MTSLLRAASRPTAGSPKRWSHAEAEPEGNQAVHLSPSVWLSVCVCVCVCVYVCVCLYLSLCRFCLCIRLLLFVALLLALLQELIHTFILSPSHFSSESTKISKTNKWYFYHRNDITLDFYICFTFSWIIPIDCILIISKSCNLIMQPFKRYDIVQAWPKVALLRDRLVAKMLH